MAKVRKTGPRSEQILSAAEHVFAQKGFHPATMAEIAKRAGVTEPTLYEYFTSKEEILFTIPLETSRKLGELIDFHMAMAKGTVNKLRVIIYLLLWIHQTNPNYAAVSYLILRQNTRFMETEAYQVLRKRLRPLIEIVKEGIATGEVRSGLSPYIIRSMILGMIEHLTTRKLMHRTDDNLLDYVDEIVDLVMGGIDAGSNQGGFQVSVNVQPLNGKPAGRGSKPAAASGKSGGAPKKSTRTKKSKGS